MKIRFIKKTIFFLLPILLGALFIEISLQKIPNDYSFKNNYLKQNAKDIELLLLGNSHMYRGVVPEDMKLKSFNAAYVSQTVDLDFLLFNLYKDELINLKFLVFGMSYSSLFSTLETSKESWRLKNYNLYYHLNKTWNPRNYSELLSNSIEVNQQKIVNYYFKNENPITTKILGGGAIERIGDVEETGLLAAKRHTKKNLESYKSFLKEYDEVIKFCETQNIKILFVTTPTYKSYGDNLELTQLSLMNHIIDSMSNKHQHVSWLNLLKSDKFLVDDFFNADHLNIKGAKKLTVMLNQKIDSL